MGKYTVAHGTLKTPNSFFISANCLPGQRLKRGKNRKVWQIIITMFVALGTTNDAIVVEQLNAKPLVFESRTKCLEHMWDNIETLKEFGRANFDNSPVKEIGCYETGA